MKIWVTSPKNIPYSQFFSKYWLHLWLRWTFVASSLLLGRTFALPRMADFSSTSKTRAEFWKTTTWHHGGLHHQTCYLLTLRRTFEDIFMGGVLNYLLIMLGRSFRLLQVGRSFEGLATSWRADFFVGFQLYSRLLWLPLGRTLSCSLFKLSPWRTLGDHQVGRSLKVPLPSC